jgi:hypothetical protein
MGWAWWPGVCPFAFRAFEHDACQDDLIAGIRR